jgi:hypothetical protein
MKRIKYLMLCLFFTTFGIMITIVVKKFSHFTIANELQLMDILSFISTIILTLYIGFILDKTKNDDRIIKDTFIGYYENYQVTLNEKIRGLYSSQNVSIGEITSVFKIVRTKLYRLNKFAVERNVIVPQSKLHEEVFGEVTKLWGICTDGEDISTTHKKEQIEAYLIKIEIMMYKLTFEINDF